MIFLWHSLQQKQKALLLCEDLLRWLQNSSNIASTRIYNLLQLMRRILYQRGIYPPEDFNRVNKYGLSMVMARNESLASYLQNMIRQVQCIGLTVFVYT